MLSLLFLFCSIFLFFPINFWVRRGYVIILIIEERVETEGDDCLVDVAANLNADCDEVFVLVDELSSEECTLILDCFYLMF